MSGIEGGPLLHDFDERPVDGRELKTDGMSEQSVGGGEVSVSVGGTDERPLGIDELLERVRAGYERINPREAYEAAQGGEALLVDIRYAALRERDGLIPGALVIERNELEWRLDPQGSHRTPRRQAMTCGSCCSATRGTRRAWRSSRYGGWGCTGPRISSAGSRHGGGKGCRFSRGVGRRLRGCPQAPPFGGAIPGSVRR